MVQLVFRSIYLIKRGDPWSVQSEELGTAGAIICERSSLLPKSGRIAPAFCSTKVRQAIDVACGHGQAMVGSSPTLSPTVGFNSDDELTFILVGHILSSLIILRGSAGRVICKS